MQRAKTSSFKALLLAAGLLLSPITALAELLYAPNMVVCYNKQVLNDGVNYLRKNEPDKASLYFAAAIATKMCTNKDFIDFKQVVDKFKLRGTNGVSYIIYVIEGIDKYRGTVFTYLVSIVTEV